MPLPRAKTVRFQLSMVKAKGIPRPTNEQASAIAREWIETGSKPDGWTIKVVIWSAGHKREVTTSEVHLANWEKPSYTVGRSGSDRSNDVVWGG